MILRWILRELRNDIRFTLVFLVTLSIGLTGFLGLDSFRKGVAKNLNAKARELLSADLAISARRALLETEVEVGRAPRSDLRAVRETEFLEFFSMINTSATARLVQVRAIQPAFPFYGKIVFRSGRIHTSDRVVQPDFLWIDRELAVQLDLVEGSRVKIWDKEFRVSEIVETDSSSSLGGSFMAPKVYVPIDSLQDRIGKFGSTVFYRRLFQFPPTIDGQEVQRLVEELIPDSSVRVLAYNSAADESGRLIQYLSDYLGLVAVVGLLLASMGTFFLFQSYFSRKEKSIALARCLGLTFAQIQKIYLLQVVLLGLVALIIALLGVSFVRTALISAMGAFLPPDLNFDLDRETLYTGIFVATLLPITLVLPFFERLRQMRPLMLIQDVRSQSGSTLRASLSLLPALLLFWGLAVWVSHSVKVGSLFLGSLLVVSLSVGLFFSQILKRVPAMVPLRTQGFLFLLRLSLRNLNGHRLSTILSGLSVTVGALLMGILPQIRSGLQQELDAPSIGQLPSLFLFDIQEDQVSDLSTLLAKFGLKMRSLTPMVRARLDSVNGKTEVRLIEDSKSKTREEEEASRSRNRGVNLTFQQTIQNDPQVVEGRQLSATPASAEISLESRYAERMGIRIGDQLKFDIQGVFIEGRVVNLRNVRWTSFEPNFFIKFGPGALEAAPKTFLATLPQASETVKSSVQKELVSALPNISAVDVTVVVGRIIRLIDDMKIALYSMAFFSIIIGWIVLFTMSNGQVLARRGDLNLMKTIGLRQRPLTIMALVEFGAVSVLGIFFGLASSLLSAHLIGRLIFQQVWNPDWMSAVTILLFSILISLAVIWFAIRRVVAEKPLTLLQGL